LDLYSSEIPSERILQLLSERHKLQAVRKNPLSMLSVTRSMRKDAFSIDDLTWMRMLRITTNDLGGVYGRSQFLPNTVFKQRIKAHCLRACFAATLFLWTVLGLGILYRSSQSYFLNGFLQQISAERVRAKVLAQQVGQIKAQRDVFRKNFDRIDAIRRKQENYLRLFFDLQDCLSSVSDAWLENFRMHNSREVITKGEQPSIYISGYLLVHEPDNPDVDSLVLGRFNELMQFFRSCKNIDDVTDINLLAQERHLQPFSCRLLLNRDAF
jgi:hypothetical protein